MLHLQHARAAFLCLRFSPWRMFSFRANLIKSKIKGGQDAGFGY